MTHYFYRSETKGIQRWIMATPRLRELRGGSAAIEAATDTARQLLENLNADIYQAAAGAIACVFASQEDLDTFASVWPWHAERLLPGLQTVQAWAAIPSEGTAPDHSVQQEVRIELGRQRNLPPVPAIEAGPLVARNARTGAPATRRATHSPGGSFLTDAATSVKESHQASSSFTWSNVNGVSLQLDESYEGLIAVVHADGTGVGRRLMSVEAVDLAEFSRKLQDASATALREAIGAVAEAHGVQPGGNMHLQVVVAGGDDLTFISRADLALDLTCEWLRRFEALTTDLPGAASNAAFKGLRAGAGIAWSSYRHPFHKAYELAENLCKMAKSAAKDSAGEPVDSVIAMRRITTSFEDYRLNQGIWRLDAHACGPTGLDGLPPIDRLRELAGVTQRLARGGLREWLGIFEEALQAHAQSSSNKRFSAPRANALWERLQEVADSNDFKALKHKLHDIDAVTGSSGPVEVSSQDKDAPSVLGSMRHTGPEINAWTPIRDALILNTIRRRAGGHDA